MEEKVKTILMQKIANILEIQQNSNIFAMFKYISKFGNIPVHSGNLEDALKIQHWRSKSRKLAGQHIDTELFSK